VGVVTRSPRRDKACDGPAQIDDPLLPGTAITIADDEVDDPKCFRFRSAVIVIPLRNLAYALPPPPPPPPPPTGGS
jgi:hypothetical protein